MQDHLKSEHAQCAAYVSQAAEIHPYVRFHQRLDCSLGNSGTSGRATAISAEQGDKVSISTFALFFLILSDNWCVKSPFAVPEPFTDISFPVLVRRVDGQQHFGVGYPLPGLKLLLKAEFTGAFCAVENPNFTKILPLIKTEFVILLKRRQSDTAGDEIQVFAFWRPMS
jgi:hypothetical protein